MNKLIAALSISLGVLAGCAQPEPDMMMKDSMLMKDCKMEKDEMLMKDCMMKKDEMMKKY
jgi:hypothetical protein